MVEADEAITIIEVTGELTQNKLAKKIGGKSSLAKDIMNWFWTLIRWGKVPEVFGDTEYSAYELPQFPEGGMENDGKSCTKAKTFMKKGIWLPSPNTTKRRTKHTTLKANLTDGSVSYLRILYETTWEENNGYTITTRACNYMCDLFTGKSGSFYSCSPRIKVITRNATLESSYTYKDL